MIFTITRVLQIVLLPPGIFLILMAIGFLIKKDCRLLGKLLIASGFLLLYLVSIGPVADALIKPLENAYHPLTGTETKIKADAIVVLSGGVRDISWLGLAPEPSEVSLERVVEGVRLFRFTHLPMMLVGGSGDPTKDAISEAEAMARTASGLGIAGKDMTVVGKARNTLESARAAKRVLKGKRIILVTSAFHMKRAAGLFKKQGFDVIPAPCGYRGEQRALSFISFIPRADNLYDSSTALNEYLSLAWYTMSRDL